MSLIIIGEAVTKVMDRYAEFAQAHGQVPWRNMRGMRNRIAHGYFDINLDVRISGACHDEGAGSHPAIGRCAYRISQSCER
jgi:hypothetical protein